MALVYGNGVVGVGTAPLESSYFKVLDKYGSGASGVPVAPADGSGVREYGR